MDHLPESTSELQLLRNVCDISQPPEKRLDLLRQLEDRVLREPEHQVVLESIRALALTGRFSPASLAVHLNNRGFPDIELEKYFRNMRAQASESRDKDDR